MTEERSTLGAKDLPEESKNLSLRFVLLLVLGLIFLVVGLFLSEPLILLSVPIMFLLSFIILQFKRPELRKIEVCRTLEKFQIREEDSCRVMLSVKNTGSNEIPLLQIRDFVPEELVGENTRCGFTISLSAGESKDMFYEVFANSFGEYSIGPMALSGQDGSGLIESRLTLDSPSKLLVFPKSAGELTGFAIGPKTTRPRPGEIVARRVGTGSDFLAVRQLLPGEHTRRINWKASARVADESKLLANEFNIQEVAETLIVIDARSGFRSEKKRDSINSYSVRAAMSIAERLLREKNRVGLLALGAITEKVAPAYGRKQFDRIGLTLAKFTFGRSSFFVSDEVSNTIRYFYPRVSQIVLISPLMDDVTLETASDLARNSSTYDLMIVSPNPLDFPLPKDHQSAHVKSREGKIALKLAVLERKANMIQLEGSGAIILDWDVTEPLEKVVAAYRRMVARRIAQMAVHR